MSTLIGTDADETIIPGTISPTVTALAGPLIVGADADVIIAGGGNDRVNGGAGNDTMLLGSGNDTAIWNPGDGSDVIDGGSGTDTLEFNGSGANERMLVGALTDGVVQLTRDVGNINMTLQNLERVVVSAGAGDDTIEAAGNLAPLVALTFDGGAGNDRILGSNGADLLLGGDGNDFIDGQQGNDVAFLGAGDDVFQWDPGDGSDVVEGQDGTDAMLFNGSNAGEVIDVSANGDRSRFTRDVANIVMDLNDVERIDFRALGGADRINVSDLTASDVREVAVDLAETTDVADTVTLQGRATGTQFVFTSSGANLVAQGIGADVVVSNAGALDQVVGAGAAGAQDRFAINGAAQADAISLTASGTDVLVSGLAATVNVRGDAGDQLVVSGNAGDDLIDAQGNLAPGPKITFDGGAGNDRLLGSNGADVLLGGDGDDFVDGQQGNDVAFLGAGNDVFQWDPGDGSDVVEGQAGTDTMLFNGSAANETFVISANGQRERFTRDVGNIVMDLDGIERIETRAGAGNDSIDASALGNRAQLSLFGEAGDDRIVAGGGDDFVNGGAGTDTVSMGGGNDRFQWNPGDGSDVIDGQGGFDTHEFNGSNGAEIFRLSANGEHATLTRNLGNIVMDQDNFERVDIAALGGQDIITISDLRGTDVREVRLDLAGTAGGTTGDGINDALVIGGGARSEFINVSASGDDVLVNGLAAQTRLANLDSIDTVAVDGNSGNDFINASSIAAGVADFTLLGGAGNDTLLAGRGGMTLFGGDGNDLLIGGSGDDVLEAGAGRDVLAGGGGNDRFEGEDDYTILDFRAGAGAGDVIDLSDVAGIDDFGDVLASARGVRGGVILDFGDDEITLLGVSASQLHADDFVI